MENKIIKALEEYRNYTIELIKCLEKEEYDYLEDFLNKRQLILDGLGNPDYEKEELSKVSKELELLAYDKKLSELMAEKRDKVKQEIGKLTQRRNANNMYNKIDYGAKIFSKKI